MTSQISGMEVAIRNAGDAISMAQTAEGALGEVSEILQRMRELGVQAANGTYSGADRVSLNAEIVQLKKELIRIGEATTFNNTKLLNGTFQDTEFELGFDESPQHTHTLTIDDVRPSQLGVWNMSSQLESSTTVSSVATKGDAAVLTTAASHNFAVGDQITYEAGGTAGVGGIPGLIDGRTYLVSVAATSTTFALTELDTAAVTYGLIGNLTGAGAKFHLATLAGAPSVAEASLAAPSSTADITETLKIFGHVGTETISVPDKSNSRKIAEAVTAKSGTTGVTAYAETNARITVTPNNSTDNGGNTIISFKLQGMNANPVTISSTVKFGSAEAVPTYAADLSDLRDKINGFSGDTGISATISFDRTSIDLSSPDGYDIVIDDFDMPAVTDTTQSYAFAGNGTVGTSATANMLDNTDATQSIFHIRNAAKNAIAAHGYLVGDFLRVADMTIVTAATPAALTIDPNKIYYVDAVQDTSRFQLREGGPTGTKVIMTGADDLKNDISFVKIQKTMNVQTLDRDGAVKGSKVKLHDLTHGTQTNDQVASSTRLAGQIIYESSNVFTLETGATTKLLKNQFRDAPPSATLLRISDIDVLTVTTSQRMLSAVDGALRRIDAERGDLGATMNRMEHTIDNLTNIVMNTKVAKGRKLDADMASESIELSKSRILQQAATSMLAQANKSMQSVLELLQ